MHKKTPKVQQEVEYSEDRQSMSAEMRPNPVKTITINRLAVHSGGTQIDKKTLQHSLQRQIEKVKEQYALKQLLSKADNSERINIVSSPLSFNQTSVGSKINLNN